MPDNLTRRSLAALLLLGAAVGMVFLRPVRLGLDLRGGTQVVLEAQDTDRVTVDGDVAARTLEVLRRRVDALGVAEPTLQRSGERRFIVELPGLSDPDEAVAVIGRTAELAFHPVLGPGDAGAAGSPVSAPDEIVLPDEDGFLLRLGPAAVGGESVGTANAQFDSGFGGWLVEIDFQGEGGNRWAALTGDAACAPGGDPRRRVAIVLDGEVISSPQVDPSIQCGVGITGGSTVITGRFSEDAAKELALLIRAGALPVPVEVVSRQTVGPTLGDAAIEASVEAALIGAGLTVIYMIAYYRLLGVLAALGLLAYGLLSYSGLLALNATLTLPGIAGFVLAIGMAVDANVLAFEGMKEEHAAGRRAKEAAAAGFRRAWSAILDSNVTTLLAALLLFFFASGAVRGFGITLSVGVVASMFAALVVTRVLAELAVRHPALASRPRLLGLEVGRRFRDWLTRRRPDILGRSRLWFAISAVVLALAAAGMGWRGLSFGVEFSGGRLVEYSTASPIDLDALRSALAAAGLPRAVVQETGEGHIAIRTPVLSEESSAAVESAVTRLGGSADLQRDEFVGPTIGDELRRKAIIALGLALAGQLLYLAIRFRWTYGTAAVAAMFHDVAILLGAFAWLGKELDGVFLAALLTVIGYSINDSVVVFDRIREHRRAHPGTGRLREVANEACLQTLPRTINTGLGALFILAALYLLGGDTLADFALALILGILVGTYSSVFTAAPLAVALENAVGERLPEPPPAKPKVGPERLDTRRATPHPVVPAPRERREESGGAASRASGPEGGTAPLKPSQRRRKRR